MKENIQSELYSDDDRLILLENEIRNFYADPENQKILNMEHYKEIKQIRDEYTDRYNKTQIEFFTKEINYLKQIKNQCLQK